MDEVQKITAKIATQIYVSGNHIPEEAVAVAEKIIHLTGGTHAKERLNNCAREIEFLCKRIATLSAANNMLSSHIQKSKEESQNEVTNGK